MDDDNIFLYGCGIFQASGFTQRGAAAKEFGGGRDGALELTRFLRYIASGQGRRILWCEISIFFKFPY